MTLIEHLQQRSSDDMVFLTPQVMRPVSVFIDELQADDRLRRVGDTEHTSEPMKHDCVLLRAEGHDTGGYVVVPANLVQKWQLPQLT